MILERLCREPTAATTFEFASSIAVAQTTPRMRVPIHITAVFILISAGCAIPAQRDAAAQPAVAAEPQPAAQSSVSEAVAEPVPAAPAAIMEPAPVPVREHPVALPAPETPAAAPAVTIPPKPQPSKAAPQAVKPPVATAPSTTRTPPVKAQTAAPQAAPPLALATLEQRLKDTSAIGVFTKLALKNQVDDLLSQFRARHEGSSKTPLAQLRQTYDQLLAKVHDLLKNGDPELATAIMSSREAIWLVLADPVRFAKL